MTMMRELAYARVAPVSWLIQHDVHEGRAMLNFSEWNRRVVRSRPSRRVPSPIRW
jgi:hypothetical protein